MAISDDAVLALAKNVGEMTSKVGDLAEAMKGHLNDPQAHSGVIPRMESLEKSRRWFRKVAVTSVVTTPVGSAVAAKMGWLGNIIAVVKASGGGP